LQAEISNKNGPHGCRPFCNYTPVIKLLAPTGRNLIYFLCRIANQTYCTDACSDINAAYYDKTLTINYMILTNSTAILWSSINNENYSGKILPVMQTVLTVR